MKKAVKIILETLMICIAIAIIIYIGTMLINKWSPIEVERYSEEYVIIKKEEIDCKNYGVMRVENINNRATLRPINKEVLKMYEIGDVVEVEVRVLETRFTHTLLSNEYKLIG